MRSDLFHIGLDVGSTTVKLVILDSSANIIFKRYQRHFSDVKATMTALFRELLDNSEFAFSACTLTVTGSGAIAVAEEFSISFVQEVIASSESVRRFIPSADVVIELGGEDAKITFLTNGVEQRMNETCAGGTGAFIDQMAAFLNTDAGGLNNLAENHTTLYPIASRCGVFAKTDILPLLNEGCSKEDIAASIFQAVVEQTIGGLACGRKIEGNVAFLGGPLTFLSALRTRFTETLSLPPENALFPHDAEYFVAIGAALSTLDKYTLAPSEVILWSPNELNSLCDRIISDKKISGSVSLPPLFKTEEEINEFRSRHARHSAVHIDFSQLTGTEDNPFPLYLGIDAGSTTLKSVLIDASGRIVYEKYLSSQGNALSSAISILKEIYSLLPPNAKIAHAGVTGYGGGLLKAALHADIDEVETLAHFKAARFFLPEVTYVLDIGGQDIKCMHIKNGIIDQIKLNEACSSGCGSFIETFAKALGIPLNEFVDHAIHADNPVDLGTRCTVFMNSRVKQSQKEGRSIGDIAAGLSYSVIKNALYKVIKIADVSELGDHVIAQGGSFKNDALLRALECILNRDVLRLDIAGLMGAFGAALLAAEYCAGSTSLLSREEVEDFQVTSKVIRCKGCSNHCLLTINKFSDGKQFVSGNRCEKGAGKVKSSKEYPNIVDYKYNRLFNYYKPLELSEAKRGVIGIPRSLNIFEDYPLWFTFFTTLGFRVELSSPSSKKLYSLGISTIPSQTVCYPAKLCHGHLIDLINKGVKRIFYPCIAFEKKEFSTQNDSYNCPVVGGYPELLRNNIEKLRIDGIELICPFLPLDWDSLVERLLAIPLFSSISRLELYDAIHIAFQEKEKFKDDIKKEGERVLKYLKDTGTRGIILAGHPYHIDPEIHHGISDLITASGMAVLTEDSIAHLMPNLGNLRVVDQWTYHARLYRAAAFAAEYDYLSLVQLVSFGCGLDAVTADQVEEILAPAGHIYTQIKIDEGANLGSARIRIRSLLAAMREKDNQKKKLAKPLLRSLCEVVQDDDSWSPPPFTKEMRKTHTILMPQMSPVHFRFLPSVFKAFGYHVELLSIVKKSDIEDGLRHVNNDVCYPAITVIGQLLHAVKSGEYDITKIALILSQTGGGCRATNYISFLKKALKECGLTNIPIISFNNVGMDKNPGFKLTLPLLIKFILAIIAGDALMKMVNRLRPYEKVPGSTDALEKHWSDCISRELEKNSFFSVYSCISQAVKEFDALPLKDIKRRPRVGLVGEILLKYHTDANNNAVKVIEDEGGEAVMADLVDFFLYGFYDNIYRWKNYNRSIFKAIASRIYLTLVLSMRYPVKRFFSKSERFVPDDSFHNLKKQVEGIVSLGQQTGEGWLLTAEMVEFLHNGIPNILCMQPFGCLPNHITGKGVIKELKRRFPDANIAAVDYDPGASEVNQINRIKLMMSVARGKTQE